MFGIAIMALCWIPAFHFELSDIAGEILGAWMVFKKPRAA
jgi:hypothetical protein